MGALLTTCSHVRPIEETVAEMEIARKEGKCKFLGLSEVSLIPLLFDSSKLEDSGRY